MDEVKGIIHNIRNNNLLGQEEWFSLLNPSNYAILQSNVIHDIHAAITKLKIPGEHTQATYALVDGVKNISAPAEDEIFKLSNVKQLELFYRARLEVIPVKVLKSISRVWYNRLASRDPSGNVSRPSIYEERKDGLELLALGLLLQHRATKDNKAKL
ncbi:hypothetical protein EJ07DRAFT_158961 [Lizonia empirigonia]|nr:hypothetical protein EJ07DRAFT_158961 [Lizonia empirigonia]